MWEVDYESGLGWFVSFNGEMFSPCYFASEWQAIEELALHDPDAAAELTRLHQSVH